MAFTIVNESNKYNRKFKLSQQVVEFKLNPLNNTVKNPEQWLKDGVREIFDHAVKSLSPGDKVGMTFTAADFTTDFHIPFKQVEKLRFEDLWRLLQQLYQSKKEAIEGDTFTIITTSFTPFRGRGRSTEESLTFGEDCKKKKGVVCIKNTDNLCLPRALVVAIAYILNVPYLTQIRRNVGKRQDQEAQKLIADAGVTIPPEGAGVEELQQFQHYLTNYQIIVYNYGTKGRDILYQGPESLKRLNLLHHDGHYNVITSLTSAFCCRYYCCVCCVPFDHKEGHRCVAQCPGCRCIPPCPVAPKEILCQNCNRQFRGQPCFDKHMIQGKNGQNQCAMVRKCKDCLHYVKGKREHYCGEFFCRTCYKYQPKGHLCFIQKDEKEPKLEDVLFIFYDLETRQDDQNARGEDVHIPVLCVYQQRCNECFNSESDELPVCSKCGVRRQILKGGNIVEGFFAHIWEMRKKFKSVVVLAHNGQAYDHHFILRHILENTDLKPKIIKRGTKLLMVNVGRRIKLIDSINYFPMKLAALPKAFGLTELKKGYFPHLFNTLKNANYIGPLPDAKYYTPNTMKTSDRDRFLQWHASQQNTTFDLQQEMTDYCISDVEILTQTCVKFHNMMIEAGNVSPFTEAITIPGACNKLFRRQFLKPNTMGVIPKNGYRATDVQSKIATQWLIYEETARGIDIQHSVKQRETKIDGIKVDGYCPETLQIFEFQGCYFHGCPKCYSNVARDDTLHEDSTDCFNARYERTVQKVARLRQKGYEVIEMWEHEFQDVLKKDPVLQLKLENHPLLVYAPLEPRDAFYGGRTGNTRSFYQCKPGEKIKYVDVCSLYPWVCKHGRFPIGHPTAILVGEEQCQNQDLAKINGLIKCKILPPTDLYHPVLPMKMNDKLMFILCRTCGQTLNKDQCTHSDDERALTGTWVTEEINKALSVGYKVLKTYEIWAYDITQFDKANNTEGLFTAMMNKFIKIKQQASGWPSECETEEQKQAYIDQFLDQEDIQLQYADIAKNPGLRSLAKLILNSFWGKLAQKINQPQCSIVRNPADLYQLSSNPGKHLSHLTIINETVLLASWSYKDEAADTLDTVNVVTAAYVTAQARLKLYSYLEKLGDRALYYDTGTHIALKLALVLIIRPSFYQVNMYLSISLCFRFRHLHLARRRRRHSNRLFLRPND